MLQHRLPKITSGQVLEQGIVAGLNVDHAGVARRCVAAKALQESPSCDNMITPSVRHVR